MNGAPVFRGAGTALVTPMKSDLSVDYRALGELIDIQTNAGIKALVVCGTTGEAATLSEAEKAEITDFAVRRTSGKAAVIAGTGSNDTAAAIRMTIAAEKAGADAVLAITPYYNRTTREGLIRHYEAICSSTALPVIAYSVPSRGGMNIDPETAKRLTRIPGIAGIKEASGNMAQITAIRAACGDSLPVWSGSDDITVPILSVGGCGVISVVSNAKPDAVRMMCEAFETGDVRTASEIQLRLLPLIHSLFSKVNPIPIKKLLAERGLIEYVLRPPLYPE